MLCKLLRILASHEVGPFPATCDTHLAAVLFGYLLLFAKGDIHDVRHELDMVLSEDEGGFTYIDTIGLHYFCPGFFCFGSFCFRTHMNLLSGYLDSLRHTLPDFYLRMITLIVVCMCQHRCTYLYAFTEVSLCCLTQRMSRVKDVIQQYDDGSLGQLAIELEVYHGQIIHAVLLLQVVERGMGRASQAVITLHITISAQIVGHIIHIAWQSVVVGYRYQHHPFLLCYRNTVDNIPECFHGLINTLLTTCFFELMCQLA